MDAAVEAVRSSPLVVPLEEIVSAVRSYTWDEMSRDEVYEQFNNLPSTQALMVLRADLRALLSSAEAAELKMRTLGREVSFRLALIDAFEIAFLEHQADPGESVE